MKKETKKELKECISAFEKAQAELQEIVGDQIAKAARDFFENDWLESFGWTQYTDYFNDGEECNFHAYIDSECIDINGENAGEHEWFYRDSNEYDRQKREVVEEISNFLLEIDSDNLFNLFGDHKEITITREGILIEDYTDHE